MITDGFGINLNGDLSIVINATAFFKQNASFFAQMLHFSKLKLICVCHCDIPIYGVAADIKPSLEKTGCDSAE